MEGFERTSTRGLVERAGANLVAIHYYFGSKEALYRAAAQHIADAIVERRHAALGRVDRLLARPRASRRELIDCVCDLYDEFAAMALAGGFPECWRRFLAREQFEPSGTGAFEVIFKAIQPSFELMFRLVARIIGCPPDDPEVRLLTTMIFGQVSVFRTNRTAALRLIGWETFGADELARIRTIGRKYIFRLFAAPGESPRQPRRGRLAGRTRAQQPAKL